ncbi:hypothetical protein DVH24_032904 [Malus domestica]|uniref:Uncharacterized protein n=1 Tax=Malus domestica TaxID=3750 RepID=A0A498IN09_MALDO|nr:hypothetical protein DVH24_032904 [Malus domestica]
MGLRRKSKGEYGVQPLKGRDTSILFPATVAFFSMRCSMNSLVISEAAWCGMQINELQMVTPRSLRYFIRVCNWGVYTRVLYAVLKHVIMFTFLIMTMMMQKISTGNPCIADSHMIREVDLSWSFNITHYPIFDTVNAWINSTRHVHEAAQRKILPAYFHALVSQPLPPPAPNSDPKASWGSGSCKTYMYILISTKHRAFWELTGFGFHWMSEVKRVRVFSLVFEVITWCSTLNDLFLRKAWITFSHFSYTIGA